MRLAIRTLLPILCVTIIAVGFAGTTASAAEKLPQDQIGEIGQPEGKIAFVRGKDLWIMNADGSRMVAGGAKDMMVQEAQNADGRISWSPDNRRIAFTRSGKVDLKGPDMLGGFHKVYDIFIAILDSAETGNKFFYRRVTDDVGSRDPQWTKDNKLVFSKDMNANMVNAGEPNYQICIADTNGMNIEVLRKNWRGMAGDFLMAPSVGPNGDIAFVSFFDQRPQGLVVLPKAKINMAMDSIKAISKKNLKCVAPSWSPDGKWIAYIKNDINEAGLFITTPDLKNHYQVFIPPVGTYLHTVSPSFSPNSKWLTFSTTDGSIWICDIGGNNAKRLSGPGADRWPAWSN